MSSNTFECQTFRKPEQTRSTKLRAYPESIQRLCNLIIQALVICRPHLLRGLCPTGCGGALCRLRRHASSLLHLCTLPYAFPRHLKTRHKKQKACRTFRRKSCRRFVVGGSHQGGLTRLFPENPLGSVFGFPEFQKK